MENFEKLATQYPRVAWALGCVLNGDAEWLEPTAAWALTAQAGAPCGWRGQTAWRPAWLSQAEAELATATPKMWAGVLASEAYAPPAAAPRTGALLDALLD